MEKIWNITIEFLAKINMLIPLVSILWAGIGLIGIVLILSIAGCAVRKRLVPQWLIWGYFIFAAIVIFAQANNDIFKVVAYIEVPFLVVLVCYFLRMLFYRRPRYTYVERTVAVREIAKKEDKEVAPANVSAINEMPAVTLTEEDDAINIDETIVETKDEEESKAEEFATEVDVASEEVAEVEVPSVVEEVNEVEPVIEENEVQVEEPVTMDLPVVEPIVEKEEPREPEFVSPASTTPRPSMTTARPATTSVFSRPTATSSLFGNRSTTSATTTAPRPSATSAARPTATNTTTTTRPTLRPYASMLGTKPTSATSTTATANTARPTSSLGTTTAAKPRSTDEIMAAIERLRASMKK